jgi:hypothetical protein
MDNTTNDLLMEGTRGRGKGSASEGSSCHHNGNWNLDEILVLIDCKHKKNNVKSKLWILKETWFL